MMTQQRAGMNGTASGHGHQGDEEPKLVQINAKVGFSTKQVLAGLGMLGAGIASLVAAGWLALPAKQQDMTAVQQSVVDLRATVGALSDHTKGLAEAVVGLQAAIYELKGRVELPRPRPVVKPKPAAPQKPPAQSGLFFQ